MKKVKLFVVAVLVFNMMCVSVFAGNERIEMTDENRYGQALEFSNNDDYRGLIQVDGVYVAMEGDEYVFTFLYSGGEIAIEDIDGEMIPFVSFFNPPNGSVVRINVWQEADRMKLTDEYLQVHVEADKAESVGFITVFLEDALYTEYDDGALHCYINLKEQKIGTAPDENGLIKGYEISGEDKTVIKSETMSTWATDSVNELKYSDLFRIEAFSQYQEGITRERFIYLMIELYEILTEEKISIDSSISFSDTDDEYALKAATVGITKGIGDGKFGPDIILNREQMTTFVMRTLNLSVNEEDRELEESVFDDHEEISDWARESVYGAKNAGIINGVGDNRFAPAVEATNEQAIAITHRLLSSYSDFAWLSEVLKERVYVRTEGKLYAIELEENLIIDENNEIYTQTYEDISNLVNAAYSINRGIFRHTELDNPNIEGKLSVDDLEKVSVEVEKLYKGVDKVGEITYITVDSFRGDKEYSSNVTTDITGRITGYEGLEKVSYKSLTGSYKSLISVPLRDVFETVGVDYELTYDESWNIYIIELEED